jgi:drug/metabolite transporter (DMT)-like permease
LKEALPFPATNNPRAIGLLLVAWLFFTTEVVAIKALGGSLPVLQILVLRFGTQAVAMALYAARNPAVMRTERLRMHGMRSLLSVLSMVCQYAAFGALPLALATTISFSQALFFVGMGALVFRERIGRARGFAAVVGFGGVLVLCRPGVDAVDPMVLVMLLGAFLGGVLMTATKLLARTDSPATIMFYVGLFNTLWVAGPAIAAWKTPEPHEILWLAVICSAGPLSHLLMIQALRIGDASALAPVDYVRLVFATVAGYFLFAETPDIWTWIGAAIILSSTFFLAKIERARR